MLAEVKNEEEEEEVETDNDNCRKQVNRYQPTLHYLSHGLAV